MPQKEFNNLSLRERLTLMRQIGELPLKKIADDDPFRQELTAVLDGVFAGGTARNVLAEDPDDDAVGLNPRLGSMVDFQLVRIGDTTNFLVLPHGILPAGRKIQYEHSGTTTHYVIPMQSALGDFGLDLTFFGNRLIETSYCIYDEEKHPISLSSTYPAAIGPDDSLNWRSPADKCIGTVVFVGREICPPGTQTAYGGVNFIGKEPYGKP
jgi:hypothetical protein